MNRIAVSTSAFLAFLVGTIAVGAADTAKAAPAVELSKVCPNLRYLGRSADFEITITNRGNSAAYNVVVTDVIPAGLEFVRADNSGVRESGKIVWRVGTMQAGESRTLKSTFLCNRIGKFKNRATVTYCAEESQECEMEVKGIAAILLECVDDPDPIELGSNLTYTVTVTNQGSAVGTNIAVNCTLPPEQEYVSSNGPTQATANGKSVAFAPVPTLAPKAKAVFRVTVKGVGVGDTRFQVEMKSDQIETAVMETESTHIYE